MESFNTFNSYNNGIYISDTIIFMIGPSTSKYAGGIIIFTINEDADSYIIEYKKISNIIIYHHSIHDTLCYIIYKSYESLYDLLYMIYKNLFDDDTNIIDEDKMRYLLIMSIMPYYKYIDELGDKCIRVALESYILNNSTEYINHISKLNDIYDLKDLNINIREELYIKEYCYKITYGCIVIIKYTFNVINININDIYILEYRHDTKSIKLYTDFITRKYHPTFYTKNYDGTNTKMIEYNKYDGVCNLRLYHDNGNICVDITYINSGELIDGLRIYDNKHKLLQKYD